MVFGREKLSKTAKEFSDFLSLIETVKSLQQAQKEMVDRMVSIDQRLRELESDIKSIKHEVKFEALKETQSIVNAVQGGLNERIQDLAVKLAVASDRLEARPDIRLLSGQDSQK